MRALPARHRALALVVVALLAADVVALAAGPARDGGGGGRGDARGDGRAVAPEAPPAPPLPPPEPAPAAPAPPPAPVTPAPPRTMVAAALGRRVGIYGDPTRPVAARSLPNPNENGAPLVFLVQEYHGDWLKVVLPVPPTGSTGWVRAEEVKLLQHSYRVSVQLRAHRITVFDGDAVILTEPIGVGPAAARTRGGNYYIKELLRPPGPNGPYGAYVYGFSGFSNQLLSPAGGGGVVGIHGTNDPSSIGRNVDHGCIRMSNAGITRLKDRLPLGTPVEVRA